MNKVYLVYGPPCSGKTTYALEHAGPNDIIVDVDRICEAISINALYEKPADILSAALVVRNALISFIEQDGSTNDAYIVGGFPQRRPRQSLVSRTHAVPIFIDTDMDTCLSRAIQRPAGYDAVIRKWFEEHEADDEHSIPWVDAFYHSSDWMKVRAQVLALDHNECQVHKARGEYKRANVVHHVHHLTDRPDLKLSVYDENGERNLISVCRECHNELHPEKGLRIRATMTEERW